MVSGKNAAACFTISAMFVHLLTKKDLTCAYTITRVKSFYNRFTVSGSYFAVNDIPPAINGRFFALNGRFFSYFMPHSKEQLLP